MMSKRHNNPFIAALDDHYVTWKSLKNEAFFSSVSGGSRQGRKGEKAVFCNINGSLNRPYELGSKALLFSLIPSSSRLCFVGGMAENSDLRHYRRYRRYRRSSFARIRFRNSDRSTNSACPASISPIRREISRSQASSTPDSRGESRLWSSSWANSARSASESARTSERRRCRGSAVIGLPVVARSVILPPIAAPNNGFNRTPVSSAPAKPGELSGGTGKPNRC